MRSLGRRLLLLVAARRSPAAVSGLGVRMSNCLINRSASLTSFHLMTTPPQNRVCSRFAVPGCPSPGRRAPIHPAGGPRECTFNSVIVRGWALVTSCPSSLTCPFTTGRKPVIASTSSVCRCPVRYDAQYFRRTLRTRPRRRQSGWFPRDDQIANFEHRAPTSVLVFPVPTPHGRPSLLPGFGRHLRV